MARNKVNPNTVVDTARGEFTNLQHVLHPLAFEQLTQAVYVMLIGLGQNLAARRWVGLQDTEKPE